MLVWDALRGGAVALAVILLVRIGVIVYRALRAGKAQTGKWRLALPHKVTNTAIGVALFILGVVAFEVDRIGEPPLWTATPLVLVGLIWANVGVRGHIRDFRPRGTPPPSEAWWAKEDFLRYVVLFAAVIFGFAATQDVQDRQERIDMRQEQTDHRLIEFQREGCRQANVLRANQSRGLREQIVQTNVSLKGDLGVLEDFRDEIKAANDARKDRLADLKHAAADHPHPDDPYQVDCDRAYPNP